jgi:chromosome segregation ATPase
MNEKMFIKILEKIEEQNEKIDALMEENKELKNELKALKEKTEELKEETKHTSEEVKKFYKAIAEEVVMTLADFIKKALDKSDEKLFDKIDEKLKNIANKVDNEEKFEKLKEYIHNELNETGKELVLVLGGNQVDLRNNIKNVLQRLDKMEYELTMEMRSIRDPLYRNRLPDGTISVGLRVR